MADFNSEDESDYESSEEREKKKKLESRRRSKSAKNVVVETKQLTEAEKEAEILQPRLIKLARLPAETFARSVLPNIDPKSCKYLESVDTSKLPKQKGEKKGTKRKKKSESIADFFIRDIEPFVDEYIQRENESDAFEQTELKIPDQPTCAPWQSFELHMKEIEATPQSQVAHSKRLKSAKEQLAVLTSAAKEVERRALEIHLHRAALVQAYYVYYVNGKLCKAKELLEDLGIEKSQSARLRRVYKLVCAYPLLIYSGVSFSKLAKKGKQLDEWLQENPCKAQKLCGGLQRKSTTTFKFDRLEMPIPQSTQEKAIQFGVAAEKLHKELKKRNEDNAKKELGMDGVEDDDDDDDDDDEDDEDSNGVGEETDSNSSARQPKKRQRRSKTPPAAQQQPQTQQPQPNDQIMQLLLQQQQQQQQQISLLTQFMQQNASAANNNATTTTTTNATTTNATTTTNTTTTTTTTTAASDDTRTIVQGFQNLTVGNQTSQQNQQHNNSSDYDNQCMG